RGVHLLRAGAAPVRAFERLRRGARGLVLQGAVAPGRRGFGRVVGGGAGGGGVPRGPAAGGGGVPACRPRRPRAARLAARTRTIAVRAARALGLDYTGVDLAESKHGPVVLEVNGTPHWDGLHAATGEDIAGRIVDHALLLAQGGKRFASSAGTVPANLKPRRTSVRERGVTANG